MFIRRMFHARTLTDPNYLIGPSLVDLNLESPYEGHCGRSTIAKQKCSLRYWLGVDGTIQVKTALTKNTFHGHSKREDH